MKSGVLTDKELAARKLAAVTKDGYEERFVYTTFSAVRAGGVERHAVCGAHPRQGFHSGGGPARSAIPERRGLSEPVAAAGARRSRRRSSRGRPHPFAHAGGYAKITRLVVPADAVLVECHLVYEEPYGWFDGINLVKQKVPVMVQEKVRTFRRKLATATAEKAEKRP